jgi:hypothetical protein
MGHGSQARENKRNTLANLPSHPCGGGYSLSDPLCLANSREVFRKPVSYDEKVWAEEQEENGGIYIREH